MGRNFGPCKKLFYFQNKFTRNFGLKEKFGRNFGRNKNFRSVVCTTIVFIPHITIRVGNILHLLWPAVNQVRDVGKRKIFHLFVSIVKDEKHCEWERYHYHDAALTFFFLFFALMPSFLTHKTGEKGKLT